MSHSNPHKSGIEDLPRPLHDLAAEETEAVTGGERRGSPSAAINLDFGGLVKLPDDDGASGDGQAGDGKPTTINLDFGGMIDKP